MASASSSKTRPSAAGRSPGTKARTPPKSEASRKVRGEGGEKASRGPRPLVPDPLILGHDADHLVASQLVDELEFRHGIDPSTLDVFVRDGRAVVRGFLVDHDELEAIQETLGEMRHLGEVDCEVQISSERREQDRDLARRIQEAIDADPELASQNVQVACTAQRAVLRGTVASELLKAKAALLALRLGGAAKVRNRLVVKPAGEA